MAAMQDVLLCPTQQQGVMHGYTPVTQAPKLGKTRN